MMNTIRRIKWDKLIFWIVVITLLLTYMDFLPIHWSWWDQEFGERFYANWELWSRVREWTALILCPICGGLAENFYFVLLSLKAGTPEQMDLLPVGYSGYWIAPAGFHFWWGQGPDLPWRKVSMLDWYSYWMAWFILWWLVIGRRFFLKPRS